jgi:8-hydroxy-5-deazaflavin:NADPH oxidoreductase
MKIAVLGTGMVGSTIGTKLIELGHEVKMGSRTAGNEKAKTWVSKHSSKASQGTFEEAARFGEMVFNCTHGMASIEALRSAGSANLKGKILIDIANALDFSKGMPPALAVSNTTSLGEEIQKTFPDVKVVKTLNTMNCTLMVNPGSIAGGDHNVFVCGNDEGAKNQVKEMLKQFGWKTASIMDIGDITGSRGAEMILPIWVRLMGTLGSPAFNFKIVKN